MVICLRVRIFLDFDSSGGCSSVTSKLIGVVLCSSDIV